MTSLYFLSVLLLKICFVAATSEGCTVPSSCILPQPLVSAQVATLEETLREVQCEMGCIEQHSVDLPIINAGTPWPSLEFEALYNDCTLYQKIYECKKSCISRFENPSLSINRCRDSCYAECESDECSQGPCDEMSCGRQCRKTFSRFGCMLHTTLDTLNKSFAAHPALSNPPLVSQLIDEQDPQKHIYQVTPNLATTINSVGAGNVAFLVKISSADGSNVNFIWQRNLSTPIDLSPYACQSVTVSHAVVSTLTPVENLDQLPFSPSTQICVPGVGGHPSPVNADSMRVVYTEDFRPGYHGYSQATLHWQRPEGFQYVTSYSLSVYPDRDSCGGESIVYKYNNIDKDLTSFTVVAREPTGLMKFGCSFLFELLALPTDESEIGPHISQIAQLSAPPPLISVSCDHIWNTATGYFNISVSWSLQPDSTPTDHIRGFTVTPVLLNHGDVETSYSPQTITPQNGQTDFHTLLSEFEPLSGQEYKVEVTSTKDSEFYWRPNPTTGSCVISSEPHPPTTPLDISISRSNFDETQNQLNFILEWVHPTMSYGGVERYDVRLITATNVQLDQQTFTAGSSVATVNSILEANETLHCVYVQMRTVNQFSVEGGWSDPLVIPLDDQCQADTSDNTGKISLFYENGDSGNVKLLELGCESDAALFAGASQSILTESIRNIQEQVLNISSSHIEQTTRLTNLEQNLLRVEQKLDALLELVASHVHGG